MVKFTKDICGVEVLDSDLPIVYDEVKGTQPSKIYKKPWKGQRAPNRTHEVRFSPLSQEEKAERRRNHAELRELVSEARAQKEERRQQAQKARELRKKRMEDKEAKGIQQAQVIADVSKTRKWSKKAKEKLMKMPQEMFEKYLKSGKQA